MGDRHGDCFARRGRALNPSRPQVDAHRGVGFRWRATAFRWRGVVGRICPRAGTRPLGEGIPTRRTSKRICPAQKHAHSAKASRHGARAKGFAPRRNTPHGEGLPTRRTSKRICSAREGSPRRRPPDTARERKDLCRGGSLSSAKASRHSARAKGFAPRENALAPRADERRAALDRRTAGKTPLRRGRTREGAAAAEFIHRKKIRLLHEIQFFYGESHVGSRPIFPSFPSVGRCVARERTPVPPVAPHCGSGHRGLRRIGEMVRRCDAMCPRGGELFPRGGRCDPGIRCFGERFHRRRCANPDACRGRRCARAHDDLGQRAFRYFRPAFRNRRRSGEKTCGGRRCSRGHDNLGQRAFRYFRPGIRHPLCDNEKTCGGRRCARGHDDLGQRAFRYFRPTFRHRQRSGE